MKKTALVITILFLFFSAQSNSAITYVTSVTDSGNDERASLAAVSYTHLTLPTIYSV